MRLSRPLASGFSYSLGNSLYLPVTSRCNSKTLPQTRGPNFLLPAHVVASLCRVRDVEEGTEQWKHWCMWLDTTDFKQKLPNSLDTISFLPQDVHRRPTIDELLEDVASVDLSQLDSIVIAGEGEPTLRFSTLTDLVRQIKVVSSLTVRLTTNGLIDAKCVDELVACGVDAVSVALMSSNAEQYIELMEPLLPETIQLSPHDLVCDFISTAVHAGLQVEVTGVERPDIDKERTQALATQLGVQDNVRWRAYFH